MARSDSELTSEAVNPFRHLVGLMRSPTQDSTKQNKKKSEHTTMPLAGFEPRIP
jgi:hypothetical protein